MLVFQFGELGEDFHHLVGTLAASRHNDDVGVGLLGQGVLQHGLAAAERSGDEARATFGDGIERVDGAHTRFHHLEGTRFLRIAAHGHLDRPFLHHCHFHILAFRVGQRGDGVSDLVLSSSRNTLHSVRPFEVERHHDFVGQPAFLDFAQPVGGHHLVASLGEGCEVPKFLFV